MISEVVDDFFRAVLPSVRKAVAWERCPWTTAHENILYCVGGTQQTVYEMRGAMRVFDGDDYINRMVSLAKKFNNICKNPGFEIDFCVIRDPGKATQDMLSGFVEGQKAAAKTAELDIDFILDERREVQAGHATYERVYLTLTTTPAALAKDQVSPQPGFSGAGKLGQSMITIPALKARHAAFCQSFVDILSKDVGLVLRPLSGKEAIEVTAELWDIEAGKINASVPANFSGIDRSEPRVDAKKFDGMLPVGIGLQIFRRAPVPEGLGVFRLGQRCFAAGSFEVPPGDVRRFDELLEQFPTPRIPRHIPIRMSVRILTGSGMPSLALREALSKMLAPISAANKDIRSAFDVVKARIAAGEIFTKAKIAVTTWGATPNEARDNISQLTDVLNAWGMGQFVAEYGDVEGLAIGTLPGHPLPIPAIVMPAVEVIKMMPLERPLGPWSQGNVLLRSEDGKVIPYQPGSSEQQAWVDLVFGPMGSGKSVLIQILNLASAFGPGQEEFPLISILDVGYSSRGLIELIRETLPPHKQWLAQHYKLINDASCAMNPFDTMPGCRYPTPDERAFLVSLLTTILTPVGLREPYPNVVEMVSQMVTETYRYFDEKRPTPYEMGVEPEVDVVLARCGLRTSEAGATWWEVTDALFERGEVRASIIAQRHAVPTLPAIGMVLNDSPSLRDQYSKPTVDGTESLVAFVTRMLQSVADRYPVFAYPTRLDFGNARIVAVDLSEVSGSRDEAMRKTGEIMYMAARSFLARTYYMDDELVSSMDCAPMYRDYHTKVLRQNRKVRKYLVYDELHNVSSPMMLRWIEQDIRVGRKYKIVILLASQRDTDFSAAIMELATNLWVLQADEKAIGRINENLPLSDYAKIALRERLKGPSRRGTPALLISKIKGLGTMERVVLVQAGAVELWSYATTPLDVDLRRMVSERVGFKHAVRKLAQRFPGGSAESEVLMRIEAGRGRVREAEVLAALIKELIA